MRLEGTEAERRTMRFGALRETCQVYAHDARDGRLVYLRDGGADELRDDARAGSLVCPMPKCSDRRFRVVGGEIRRHHFRHLAKGLVPHRPREIAHHDAVNLVAGHLRGLSLDASVHVPSEGREHPAQADVELSIADGRRFRVYVECGRLSSAQWWKRHSADRSEQVTDVWLFSHLSPHFRRPRHESESNAVLLGSLLEEIRTTDVPIYFLDHLRAELATALVETGQHFPRERGVAITVDPLADCEIVGDGFLSPAAREERRSRLKRIERAERLERERLEHGQRGRQRPASADSLDVSGFVRLVDSTPPRTLRVIADDQRRENAARWDEARTPFLKLVGLTDVPAVISVELDSDSGIQWLAPAHWHARYFWKFIQGRLAQRFEFYDALEWFHGQHERHGGAFEALQGYNDHLRRAGYLDFRIDRADLPVTITILADLTHPPARA